jgi:hypothetical protein
MRCRFIAGAIVCGPRLRCATTACRGDGSLLCDFPVKRRGRDATCNRRVCRRCAAHVGDNLDFCPPHARVHAGECARRAEEEKFKALLAEFRLIEPEEP